MAALGTGIDMAAQRRRAAALDGPQALELLPSRKLVGFRSDEAVALRANDVGHLHGRPAHPSFVAVVLALSLLEAATASSIQWIAVRMQMASATGADNERWSPDLHARASTWIVRRSVPASSRWVA